MTAASPEPEARSLSELVSLAREAFSKDTSYALDIVSAAQGAEPRR